MKDKATRNINSREVAHLLDCSPDDAIVLARQGRIRASRTGRFWWFALADVLRYRRDMIREARARAV